MLNNTHPHLPERGKKNNNKNKLSHTDVSFDDYVWEQSWQGYTDTGAHSVSWSLQDKILPGAVLTAARNLARTPAARIRRGGEKERGRERGSRPHWWKKHTGFPDTNTQAVCGFLSPHVFCSGVSVCRCRCTERCAVAVYSGYSHYCQLL